ncbi:hypothetical protein Ccrd_006967, partial [Cynara cardunculus var. scolymus]
SVSFFEVEKPETVVSRWSRARTRAAKIDPRHHYGHNLQFYYMPNGFIARVDSPFSTGKIKPTLMIDNSVLKTYERGQSSNCSYYISGSTYGKGK